MNLEELLRCAMYSLAVAQGRVDVTAMETAITDFLTQCRAGYPDPSPQNAERFRIDLQQIVGVEIV